MKLTLIPIKRKLSGSFYPGIPAKSPIAGERAHGTNSSICQGLVAYLSGAQEIFALTGKGKESAQLLPGNDLDRSPVFKKVPRYYYLRDQKNYIPSP